MYEKFDRTDRCYALFPDKGVEVILPPDVNYRVSARVIQDEEWEKIKDNKKNGFTELIRRVINFEIVNDDNTTRTEFDSPIQLTVYFSYNEYKKADYGNELKLAFLPKDRNEWKLFDKEKHKLDKHPITNWEARPSDPDSWFGFFTAEFDKWGDPSVSVGR